MDTSTQSPQSPEPEFKKCPRCKGDFWLSEFEPRNKHGYLKSYCKACRQIDLNKLKRYRGSREEYNAYQRDYQSKLRRGDKPGRLLSDL